VQGAFKGFEYFLNLRDAVTPAAFVKERASAEVRIASLQYSQLLIFLRSYLFQHLFL
jgi:hypothetical protein